ncbi:putative tail fiber protein, partial [uncultured Caudovirales phage]
MAVPAGPTEKRYTGNGVTTIYTIPFLLLAASDLDVFIDGAEVVSGFVITGAGNPTSTITFTTAPADQSAILLTLNIPFERLNDYQENGDFLSSTVNRDFDRIWQALKQLLRFSGRALSLGFFDVDGAGAYRAKGNRISDLGDPVLPMDATNQRWTKNFFTALLESVSGLVNTTTGILYDAGTLFDYLKYGLARRVDSVAALRLLS